MATDADSSSAATSREQSLRQEYAEVANNFRLLTDIRFKLLALLPIAAAAAVAIRGAGDEDTTSALAALGLSLFGLVVTIGVMTYNARNDQLYNELVGRGAEIERELHLPDGAFAHRPNSWFSVKLPFGRRWPVDHGTGVTLIYTASLALWLFMVFYAIAQLAYGGDAPSWWATAAALALAIGTTWLGWHVVRTQRKARVREMRTQARCAVGIARSQGLPSAADDETFRELCAALLNTADTEKVGRRASFYADLDEEARAKFIPCGESPGPESFFVGLITDLPPRWIRDTVESRR